MKLNDAARALIGSGADATLVTLNPDGSPQVSLVWVAVQTGEDGDELVTAHLSEHKKVRNVRRDGRVALTIVSTEPGAVMRPYLSVTGTARIVEGGAPEVLRDLAAVMVTDDNVVFPPDDAPPGYLTRIRIDTVGGIGPWAS
ncbi:TIGR03618 family F420-dependent PPOX class oxidoreductase [Mycobacterium sp. SA01]|uniref:TIGR03618 family F420-dependent PPOX class oxidoreductase n=1 Tax=Mycobacterium sp. SA01 TaxID=3238820 RepID=UPI00351BC4EE